MAPAPNGKLTKANHAVLVKAIRKGAYRGQAAALARVSRRSLNRWLQEGGDESDREVPFAKARYRALYEDVMIAEAEFEQECLDAISAAGKASPQNWTALAWRLERKYPERYGQRQQLQIEGDAPLVNINVLGNGAALSLANQLLESLAAPPPMLELPSGDEIDGEVVDESG
jgi:hypothetical protein